MYWSWNGTPACHFGRGVPGFSQKRMIVDPDRGRGQTRRWRPNSPPYFPAMWHNRVQTHQPTTNKQRSKDMNKKIRRVFPVSPIDPATGNQARDKDDKPVRLWFPYPVAFQDGKILKNDGTVADEDDVLSLRSTPLKDNVRSATSGEDFYYDADTMTDDEKKALRASNALTVGSKRLSDALDKIAAAEKSFRQIARFIPEANRTEGIKQIEAMVAALKATMFPTVSPDTGKKSATKVNHFSQWFQKA